MALGQARPSRTVLDEDDDELSALLRDADQILAAPADAAGDDLDSLLSEADSIIGVGRAAAPAPWAASPRSRPGVYGDQLTTTPETSVVPPPSINDLVAAKTPAKPSLRARSREAVDLAKAAGISDELDPSFMPETWAKDQARLNPDTLRPAASHAPTGPSIDDLIAKKIQSKQLQIGKPTAHRDQGSGISELLASPQGAPMQPIASHEAEPPIVGAEENDASAMDRLSDVGISVLKGAIGVPEAAVGLADIVSGGRSGKAAASMGFEPGVAKQILDTYYSKAQQGAFKNVREADGVLDTIAAALSNPSVIAQSLAESAPAMLAGGAAARLVKAAPWIAGAIGEGAVTAGSAAEQARQSSESGLITPKQAALATATGAGTSALGIFGGKIAKALGIADVDALLAGAVRNEAAQRGLVKQIAYGALQEGFLEELPQSVQEQILANASAERPLDEGLDQAAVLGVFAGVTMGAGAQLTSGLADRAGRLPVTPPVATGESTRDSAGQRVLEGELIGPGIDGEIARNVTPFTPSAEQSAAAALSGGDAWTPAPESEWRNNEDLLNEADRIIASAVTDDDVQHASLPVLVKEQIEQDADVRGTSADVPDNAVAQQQLEAERQAAASVPLDEALVLAQADELLEQQERAAATPPQQEAPAPVPNAPVDAKPGEFYTMRPDEIAVDPARFQFKGGGNAEGVTSTAKIDGPWNEARAGVLMVWKDPDDGKTYCVDEETEILTKRGWCRWDQISSGDTALTLNHETGQSEWQSIDAVNVFPPHEREMLLMEGKSHSSLTTLDHRWPVLHLREGAGKAASAVKRWRTSETLTFWDAIVLAAECDTLPEHAAHHDALVELVAWAWTEGSIAGKLRRNLTIHQSREANPRHCENIRNSLQAMFGPPRPSLHDAYVSGARRTYRSETAWAECDKTGVGAEGMSLFKLTAEASALILEHLDERKEPKPEFLVTLTKRQLATFIQRCIDADGWDGRDRTSTFVQATDSGTRLFQMACALLGVRACATWVDFYGRVSVNPNGVPIRSSVGGCFHTTVSKGTSPKTVRPIRRHRRTDTFRVERVIHQGTVWCPTTANGSWLARRKGTVYYTGNTVNGHHRLEAAKRLGAERVAVRYVDAPDATTARVEGALTNISEDKGTPLDAAKLIRDGGYAEADLVAAGLSSRSALVRDALGLARLSDPLFARVVSGDVSESIGGAIGSADLSPEGQAAVVKLVDRQKGKGRILTPAQVRALADDVAQSPEVKAGRADGQTDIFGLLGEERTQNVAVEKAVLRDWARQQLEKDKRLFGYVAKEDRAETLARAGNTIDVEASRAIADEAGQLSAVFDRLAHASGPVSSALNAAAVRIAEGSKAHDVRPELLTALRAAVASELGVPAPKADARGKGPDRQERPRAHRERGTADLDPTADQLDVAGGTPRSARRDQPRVRRGVQGESGGGSEAPRGRADAEVTPGLPVDPVPTAGSPTRAVFDKPPQDTEHGLPVEPTNKQKKQRKAPSSTQGMPMRPPDPLRDETQGAPVMPVGMADDLVAPAKPSGGRVSLRDVIHSLADVTAAAGKLIQLRIGRVRGPASGQFNTHTHVARTRAANDVPTATHEVAHAIQMLLWPDRSGRAPWMAWSASNAMRRELDALGKALYTDREPVGGYKSEGWAEFVRIWVTESSLEGQPADLSQLAPRTLEWFTQTFAVDHPKVYKALDTTRDLTRRWRKQGSMARAEASVVDQGTFRARATAVGRAVRLVFTLPKLVEMAQPLHDLAREAETVMGRPLAPNEDPFLTTSALRTTHAARTKYMVDTAMIDLAGNRVGPALAEIRSLVTGQRDEFTIYLWARRAVALHDDPLGPRNPGLSRADAVQIIRELQAPAFELAASKVYAWNNGVLDYAGQASPTFAQVVAKVRQRDPGDYVPLQRVFEDFDNMWARSAGSSRGAATSRSPVKRLTGSGRQIKDIFPVMIGQAENTIRQAHQRLVLDQILKLASLEGMGHLIEEVAPDQAPASARTVADLLRQINREVKRQDPSALPVDVDAIDADVMDTVITFFAPVERPKGRDPIVPIYDQGKVRWFQVDGPLYDTLASLDVYRLPDIAGVPVAEWMLGKPAALFRAGTTGLRASFSLIWNPLKDVQTFSVNTRSTRSSAVNFAKFLRGMVGMGLSRTTGHTSAWVDAWIRLGGEMAQPLGQDIPHTRRAARQLFEGRVVRTLDPRNWFDFYRDLIQFPEGAGRVAELELVAQQVGWQPGSPMTLDQSLQLLLASKQVTTDFTAAGEIARVVNRMVPFHNAAIQGPRASLRAARRNPALFAWRGLQITAITLLLWWQNKDDEWYASMPYRDRFLHWWFPTTIDGREELARIPRAFDIGMIFAALPEMLMDAWYREEPEQVKEWFETFLDTTTPPVFPVIPRVAKEQWQNRQWPDRPIVPLSLSRRPADEQYTEYTSRAAILIGDLFEVSPLRVEHAIRGTLGPVAMDVISLTELGSKGAGIDEPADWPLVGRLFQRGGVLGTQPKPISDLYELAEQAQLRQYSDRDPENARDRQQRLQLGDATTAISALMTVRRYQPGVDTQRQLTALALTIAKEALGAHKAGTLTRPHFANYRQWAEDLKDASKPPPSRNGLPVTPR